MTKNILFDQKRNKILKFEGSEDLSRAKFRGVYESVDGPKTIYWDSSDDRYYTGKGEWLEHDNMPMFELLEDDSADYSADESSYEGSSDEDIIFEYPNFFSISWSVVILVVVVLGCFIYLVYIFVNEPK